MKKGFKIAGIGCLGLIGLLVLILVVGGILGGSDDISEEGGDEVVVQEEGGEEEVVEYTEVNMTDFLAEYDKNKLVAERKWTGEGIQTTGYISNISSALGEIYVSIEPSDDEWYLGNSIYCYPKNSEEEEKVLELENEQVVTVRGIAEDMSVMSVGIKDCEIVD